MIGKGYPQGESDFQNAGFTNITQACQVAAIGDPPGSFGKIVSQTPSAGAVVGKNTAVTLTVRQATCP